MKAAPTKPTAGSSRRKQNHVSRACNTCRRRKSRCDGIQPVCAACATSGHDCTWTAEEDSRRPATKQYVESLKFKNRTLEDQVAALKAKLSAHGIPLEDHLSPPQLLSPTLTQSDISSGFLTPGGHSPRPDSDSHSDAGGTDVGKLTTSTGRLVLEHNDLHLYGPTSAFINISPVSPAMSPRGTIEPQERDTSSFGRSPNKHAKHHLYLNPLTEPADRIPVCDWQRHLPKEVSLTRIEHDTLLDRLFKFSTCWGFRLNPELFLRDMYIALTTEADSPQPPKTPHYSPMLHNAVLAVAMAYSDSNSATKQENRRHFAKKAKDYIEQEGQRPQLSVVHALALLSSYHSGLSEQSLGFMYFGMSVRMSQALGLSVDCSEWVRSGHITHEDMLHRISTFWATFCEDKSWSLYVGRDFSVPLPNHDLPLPQVDPQMDNQPWDSNSTKPSHVSLAFAETCKLYKIATRIMDAVYGMSRDTPPETSRNLITDIHLQLDTWQEHLPDDLRVARPKTTTAPPHTLMLNLAFAWLTILLHRPYYHAPHTAMYAELSIKRCDTAAEKIVHLFSAWRRLYTLRFVPIAAIQIAYAAGTTCLLGAVHSASKPVRRRTCLQAVRECIRFLHEMSKTWDCAMPTAEILAGLFREQISSAELSPTPSRRPTVEVTPPSAPPSRSQSLEMYDDAPTPQAGSPSSSGHPILAPLITGAALTLEPAGSSDTEDTDGFLNQLYPHDIPALPASFGMFQYPTVSSFPNLQSIFHPSGLGMRSGETFPSQPYVAFGQQAMVIDDDGHNAHGGSGVSNGQSWGGMWQQGPIH